MQRELEKACDNNDYKTIDFIANMKDTFNFNLNFLCRAGNLELVKYLVEKGIKLNNQELQCACISGNLELVKYIVEKGFNNYNTAIYGACVSKNIDIMKYLVEELNIPITTDNIVSACNTNNSEIINYLIVKSPESYNKIINNKNHHDYELVLSGGQNKQNKVNSRAREDLLETCIRGNLEEIKFIIEEKKGLQDVSNFGLNWYLSRFGDYDDPVNYDIIDYFIDLAKKNNEIIRPPQLTYICWSGDLKLVKYFVENYSYNEYQLNDAIESLRSCRNDNYVEIIKYLYSKGANDYMLVINVVDQELQELVKQKTNIYNKNISDYLNFKKVIST